MNKKMLIKKSTPNSVIFNKICLQHLLFIHTHTHTHACAHNIYKYIYSARGCTHTHSHTHVQREPSITHIHTQVNIYTHTDYLKCGFKYVLTHIKLGGKERERNNNNPENIRVHEVTYTWMYVHKHTQNTCVYICIKNLQRPEVFTDN